MLTTSISVSSPKHSKNSHSPRIYIEIYFQTTANSDLPQSTKKIFVKYKQKTHLFCIHFLFSVFFLYFFLLFFFCPPFSSCSFFLTPALPLRRLYRPSTPTQTPTNTDTDNHRHTYRDHQ